jgi:hypothetical protein
MSYELFFQTASQENRFHQYYGRAFKTLEEALQAREQLIKEGYRDEKVIFTRIEEGYVE